MTEMKLLAAMVMSLFLLASASPHASQVRAASGSGASPVASSENSHTISITRSGSQPQPRIGRIFYRCRAYRFPIPTERSRARWRRDCDVRAGRSHRLAHAPAGSDADRDGGGWLDQQWGGPIQEMKQGDVVWIPPGVKHWHGATANESMTHIAIAEDLDGKTVEWMEKVSDEQYRGPSPVM